ncbi:hypothetical protein CD117_04855 [Mammaliicoccus sciuri]|uniref:YugN-like family protein n=1 Tax=Mammaliicoccus sciuri TaxID=1296 RepID=A0AAJ4SJ47_MAMSC|nr:YugN family protein [Mammaliicoccus sciuri]RTX73918.1 hypothetical protein CD117_04855 [Mammaliicoccus sciuri]
MVFDNTGLEKVIIEQELLKDVMNKHGFIAGGHWDYERITYDFKYEISEGVYYLRIPGYALKGDIGANNATIQLLDPYLGKHYYPTGVEYGDDEVYPDNLVAHCNLLIERITSDINALNTLGAH